MSKKKWKNPFYTLLIPVGLVFVITGFAYGFMAFQAVNSSGPNAGEYADHPLFHWLNKHGDTAMLIELAVLAVLTVGAISTDSWWMQEGDQSVRSDQLPADTPPSEEGELQSDG